MRSTAHRMHSSLMASCNGTRVMIDCGADWLDNLGSISPDAIVLTHAHPDHASGLARGAPCPVYATAETWRTLDRMPIARRERLAPGATFQIGPFRFETWAVAHSVIAPAVGYRIGVGEVSLFYVPDVLSIPDSATALANLDIYIGDGARLEHPIIRGKGAQASGHASIREQLSWCADAKVRRAIFTHCGTPIINADSESVEQALEFLARPLGIEASFACDGEKIRLGHYRGSKHHYVSKFITAQP